MITGKLCSFLCRIARGISCSAFSQRYGTESHACKCYPSSLSAHRPSRNTANPGESGSNVSFALMSFNVRIKTYHRESALKA